MNRTSDAPERKRRGSPEADTRSATSGTRTGSAPGSCMDQEPGIHHRVLEDSDDCTVIEITMPADFPTVTVAP